MNLNLTGLAAVVLTVGLSAKPPLPAFIKTPSGLQYVDMRPGHGKSPVAGQTCSVLYRGWLYNDKLRGPLFVAAQNPRQPFRFQLGQGKVVAGLDEGVKTMKAGAKRVLIVPSVLGYGDQGSGDAVPPGSTLLFEVELLSFK